MVSPELGMIGKELKNRVTSLDQTGKDLEA